MFRWMLALSLLAASAAPAPGQFADRKFLTLEGAKKIAAAAEAEARKNAWNVVIAVVDDGGQLIYLQRMDDTQTASIEVAIGKARTAAMFRRPSKAFEDTIAGGRQAVLSLPNMVLLEGGLPIAAAGKVVGAIGVSGVLSTQDAQIAAAGLKAIPAK